MLMCCESDKGLASRDSTEAYLVESWQLHKLATRGRNLVRYG